MDRIGLYVYVVEPDQTVARQHGARSAATTGTLAVIAKGLERGSAGRHRRPVAAAGRHQGRGAATRRSRPPRRRNRRLRQRDRRRMSISTPFIRRPVATSLLMAAFVLVGIAAYPLLPVAPLPRVDFPTISVNAKFPGASPETMATTVAQPLERPVRADRRRRAADLDQRAGPVADHHPVRPGPQHRRRRRRRAGGDQRRQRAVAEEPAVAADLSARSTRPTRRS